MTLHLVTRGLGDVQDVERQGLQMRREQWGGEERCPERERGCLFVRDDDMVGPERRC